MIEPISRKPINQHCIGKGGSKGQKSDKIVTYVPKLLATVVALMRTTRVFDLPNLIFKVDFVLPHLQLAIQMQSFQVKGLRAETAKLINSGDKLMILHIN